MNEPQGKLDLYPRYTALNDAKLRRTFFMNRAISQ